jgi:two-component system NtrC family sensor kinase
VAAINEGHIYKFIPKPWNDEELRVTIQNSVERYLLQKMNCELLEKLATANLALEEKVQQRNVQLELRNQELEFSQRLLSSLPVGVVGIAENGVVSYCNDIASKLLKNDSCDIIGTDAATCCDTSLDNLAEQVRREKSISSEIALGGTTYRVLGHAAGIGEGEVVLLVFKEAKA